MEPPSKRTTLMYDYTIILLEPLHCSSLSVSSPQPQISFHSQISHFSPSILFAFLIPFLFVCYHCEPSGRGLSLSELVRPTLNNCISVCPLSAAAQVSPSSIFTPALFLCSALPAPLFASFMCKMSSSIFGS